MHSCIAQVEFESKHPGSIPGCKAPFFLAWDEAQGTVLERQGRWKGMLESGAVKAIMAHANDSQLRGMSLSDKTYYCPVLDLGCLCCWNSERGFG